MVLGMLLLAPFSQILIFPEDGTAVSHYGHNMTQVYEHDAKLALNQDHVKLQQVVRYASNLKMGFSHLIQQMAKKYVNKRSTQNLTVSNKKDVLPALDAFVLGNC